MRGLGVTSATRAAAMPELPSISEFVPGYELSTWYGMGAPRGTPAAMHRYAQHGDERRPCRSRVKQRFTDLGEYSDADDALVEFGAFMAAEIEKLAKVVKFADLKAD